MAHINSIIEISFVITPHVQRERGKVIGRGVHIYIYIYIYICLWSKKKIESYFRDRLTFSNIDSRTSRRIYRLALLLRAPETLSSLSKSRIPIFGRAKRAPHWGVQSRFCVIYICMSVCRYVCLSWSKKRRRKYVGQTRACLKSVLCGKIRPVTPVLLISTIRYSSFSMDGRETFTQK